MLVSAKQYTYFFLKININVTFASPGSAVLRLLKNSYLTDEKNWLLKFSLTY